LVLYLLLFEKRKKKLKERKKWEKWPGDFPPGQTHLSGCASPGFPWLLVAIKSCFKS
jgi:hypothetical protein